MHMKTRLLAAAAALLVATPALAQPIPAPVQKRIDRILKRTPLIDGHNDVPEMVRTQSAYFGARIGTKHAGPFFSYEAMGFSGLDQLV